MYTSVNLWRYLVQLDGLSLRNKLLALLLWHTGPEVRSMRLCVERTLQPDPDAVAALPYRTPEDLLDAISDSIYQQPPLGWSTVINPGQLRAVPEVKTTVHLAQQSIHYGYDAAVLIQQLAEIACHASFTEMHAFKHHQAIVEEFYATREPCARGISSPGCRRRRFRSERTWKSMIRRSNCSTPKLCLG